MKKLLSSLVLLFLFVTIVTFAFTVNVSAGDSDCCVIEETVYCQEGIGSWKEYAGGIFVCQFNDSLPCELRPMCQ